MGFNKGIEYISTFNALDGFWINKLIIFLNVMPFAMGFDKKIDYIPHHHALRNGF